jgi:ferritin-like metal-binding protein YciE
MSKELKSLHDLYIHEIKDIYSAEKQLTRALPKMAKAARSEELRQGFETHLEETEGQIERLEEILKRHNQSTTGPKCKGMEGLLAEGEEMIQEEGSDAVIDAGLIVAAQKVEHYEIATYGSLCTFAKMMGHDEDLELLKETLNEEESTDEKLTEVAMTINEEAEEGSEEAHEEEKENPAMARSKKRTPSASRK